MKYLLGIISLNIKQHLYFKISAVFSIFSLLFLFLIKSSVWSQIGNADYISYFAIITIVSSFISVNTDRYFQTIYQTGSISFLLLRPINFGINIFLQDSAAALTRFILKSLPLLIVLILFFDVNIYHGIINLYLFIFSVFCAYLFNWFTAYIIGLCVFFYGNNEGFIQIKNILFLFFSGSLIPVDFFPEVLQKILNYLPFRILYQIPIEVLNNSNLKSFSLISRQLYWIFFLLVFTYIFHRTAIKKIEIMGG
ncbi:ABC-2 family transporter protein [Treponema denticola]|uniref:ABC transporter permease n=1 Tax=Treponema denticola TaxID=158 RepID=UPI0020A24A51|nr:ABC-2 family transporter protein [Treponema denticola]UTD06516.1 ABC-2 family transporter protein [Treponema denticola]